MTQEATKSTRKEKRLDPPKDGVVVTLAETGSEQIIPLGSVVYVGPTLKTVPQFAVFSNGLPKALESLKVNCPAIEGLIVPTARLNNATVALKQVGSKESILFEQVQNYLGSED
ncbi:hypothetical protein EalM137_00051 [Exiguobacterium phage vB_EalM-137]|nr:hypothetical protein EalM137_00051 [Exiguobacterium phage vB_EalM-137]